MGGGVWSASTYNAVTSAKIASGASFAYSSVAMAAPAVDRKAHPTLDPNGVDYREARDSTEHPTSTPIAVIFDVTGSMSQVPILLQKALPSLLGQVTEGDYVPDPQIMFGAVGDATCDRVPLQVGQFESDNRMDEDLDNLVLEAGGGGQMTESYELAMYFMARHVVTDAWEKRQEKGFLFLIGDELAYDHVKKDEVARVIGDGLQDDIPIADIVAELTEKWHVFFIIPGGSSHYSNPALESFWSSLLAQNVLKVDSMDVISKEIAYKIGELAGFV